MPGMRQTSEDVGGGSGVGVSESWTFELLRLHAKTLGVRERGSVEVVDSAGLWW